MVRPPLHSPETVLSRRHMPSWFMLCAAAGLVNAGAFLAVERYVSHVTGTVTRAGIGFNQGHWTLMAEYALVLFCFVVGAFGAALLVGRPGIIRSENVVHALPLVATAMFVAAVAGLGHSGLFGPFGRSVEQPADFAFLCLLSIAMGAQNAAVATNTGLLVRTTHLTGPATDLGLSLAATVLSRGEARIRAFQGSVLRAGKILAFGAGAALMVPLAAKLGYLAFLVPSALTLAATALSFVPRWAGLHAASSRTVDA